MIKRLKNWFLIRGLMAFMNRFKIEKTVVLFGKSTPYVEHSNPTLFGLRACVVNSRPTDLILQSLPMTPSLISSSLIRYCIGHIKRFWTISSRSIFRKITYTKRAISALAVRLALEQLHRVRTHVLDVGGGNPVTKNVAYTKQTTKRWTYYNI